MSGDSATPLRRASSRSLAAVAAAVVVLLGSTAPSATGQEAAEATRLAGADRWATAAAVADATDAAADGGGGVVVLATGQDWPDALAAGAAAAALDAPLLLTARDALPTATLAAVEQRRPTAVVVAGGPGAVSEAVLDELATVASTDGVSPQVRRAAGADRFATAAALAERAFPDGADVVHLVSGATFADALGAGAAAARLDGPVLLTAPDALPAATADALADLGPDRVVVVGGEAAVGPSVVAAAAEIVGGGVEVRRVSGTDRFATSAALATATDGAIRPDETATETRGVVVSGTSFADALAAAPLAGQLDAPVLLARRTCVPAPVAEALATGAGDGVVLVGGAVAVGVGVERLRTCGDEGEPVDAEQLGASWRPGCPVGPEDLRLVAVDHRRLDGSVATGEVVVHADVVEDTVAAFDAAFLAGARIERVEPVDVFDGDDLASMDANNTSAFNCRRVTGGTRWSDHAFGRAIDVNPVQNPYVTSRVVLPPAGSAYLDRDDVRPGMLTATSPLVAALRARGWTWGGEFRSLKDYQHLSRDGG